MLSSAVVLLLASLAAATPAQQHSGIEHVKRASPEEVARLFSRQDTNYPPVNVIVDSSRIPKAWLDKLATINLPNIPVAVDPSKSGRPTYPGRDVSDKAICSFTYSCTADDDIFKPAAGKWAITFDDGPSGGSEALEAYLKSQNAMGDATHFMIGSYITYNTDRFQSMATAGAHIASHTWSHNYMTTLTNEQIVGELGWSLQIMSNLNGGRISKFWRPPYGDVDNRVRAIAKGVFGLETVVWTHDTADWNLESTPGYTVDSVTREATAWFSDKSQGINSLEHEVRVSQPEVFKRIYPHAKELGWEVGNVADTFGMPWYQNAQDGNSTVSKMDVAGAAPSGAAGSASSSASASASGASSVSAGSTISSMSARSAMPSMTSASAGSAAASQSATTSVSAAAQSVSPSTGAGQRGVAMASSGILAGLLAIVAAAVL